MLSCDNTHGNQGFRVEIQWCVSWHCLACMHCMHAPTWWLHCTYYVLCCKADSCVLQTTLRAAKHPPCCKAPSVLQSTRCCKATSVLQSTTYYVLQRYCLCCKATDSDTSAVLTDAAWYVQCHKDCDLLQLSARLCWMYLWWWQWEDEQNLGLWCLEIVCYLEMTAWMCWMHLWSWFGNECLDYLSLHQT